MLTKTILVLIYGQLQVIQLIRMGMQSRSTVTMLLSYFIMVKLLMFLGIPMLMERENLGNIKMHGHIEIATLYLLQLILMSQIGILQHPIALMMEMTG